MLAHIRSGQLQKIYHSEKAWITLEDGRKVSPLVEGFVDGNDKIVSVVEETQDTSSTGPKTRTDTGWLVEENRVYRRRVIRDKTTAEKNADAEKDKTQAMVDLEQDRTLKALKEAVYQLGKNSAPKNVFRNRKQFNTWLKSLM